MKIFLAGASGVIGIRLIPLLIAEGHGVFAMTRTKEKCSGLRALGATPVVCDVFDASSLNNAVGAAMPDLLMHQVTDLPDALKEFPLHIKANDRIRMEGTRNLIAAAQAAGTHAFMAQSIAWTGGPALKMHDAAVLEAGGTIVKYGQFYGPGTYYEASPPRHPRIHIDEAAKQTMSHLHRSGGVVAIAEPQG